MYQANIEYTKSLASVTGIYKVYQALYWRKVNNNPRHTNLLSRDFLREVHAKLNRVGAAPVLSKADKLVQQWQGRPMALL